jgi:outer membrane lipoprotein
MGIWSDLGGGLTRVRACVAIAGLLILSGITACAAIPSKFVKQAEPGVTLTQLRKHPEAYTGKVVILGGAIIEKREDEGQIWLLVRNRPLDADYVPHIAVSLGGSEDGNYWVVVRQQGLPKTYASWARLTVVGLVTDQRAADPGTIVESGPVLMAMYLHGWDAGMGGYGLRESSWEATYPPNTILSAPKPVLKKE